MYSLLFRNRWFAALWALAMLGSAYAMAKRGLPGDRSEASAKGPDSAEEEYARWVSEGEKPAGDGEDARVVGAYRQDVRIVELREAAPPADPGDEFAAPDGTDQ